MLNKIAKGILLSLMCTFIFTGNAYAGKAFYVFSLGNSGTTINHFSSSTNNKTIQSNPWTLKINSITCIGNYGIRFAPAKYNTTTKVASPCTKSGTWRNGTGYGTTAYASGDASITTYKLGARQDDSYISTFKSTGWWNADRLRDN